MTGAPIDSLRLWGILYGALAGYLVTLVGRQSRRPDARPNELGGIEQRSWSYPCDRERAAEYLSQKSEVGYDVYFGVHLFQQSGNRRKQNALSLVGAAWVDGDGAKPPRSWPQPNVVVESSPGREHYYWLLSEPVEPAKAAQLAKKLAYGMDGDRGKWGLGTVLRPPGTRNYKRATPTEVTAVLTHERRWSVAELNFALPELPKSKTSARPAGALRSGVCLTAPGSPVVLSGKALDIYEGRLPIVTDTGGVDRSATLMQIGRVVRNAGLGRHTLVEVLKDRDRELGYGKYISRPEEYDRIVGKLEGAGGSYTPPAGNWSRSFQGPPTSSSLAGGTTDSSSLWKSTATSGGHNCTDLGNARRFVDLHGGLVRYCHPWVKWMVFSGARWEIDTRLAVEMMAKDVVSAIAAEAQHETDSERRKQLLRWALSTESAQRIRSLLELAKSEPGIPVGPEELDADPWLFNAQNGTVDLRTGVLRAHHPADMITMLAPVDYDAGATAPVWERFLEEVLPSPTVRRFLRRLIGYSLYGGVQEHVLPVLHGSGANGKSTFVNAILRAVGDYGLQAADDLLVLKGNTHPTEKASLFGKRFVVNVETEEGKRFAETLVKRLTGGDKVSARRMREDFWAFDPSHTLFLATNHKPQIVGTDNAIWRRLRLVPFGVTIPPERQDRRLPERLEGEMPGILRWAVEGCMEWQREGLGEPDEVRAATEGYRAEMDVLAAYLDERCVVADRASVPATPLYADYCSWCQETGEKVETQRRFGMRLRERGFERQRITSGGRKGQSEWIGIGLLHPGESPNVGRDNGPPSDPGSGGSSDCKHSIGDHSRHENRGQDAEIVVNDTNSAQNGSLVKESGEPLDPMVHHENSALLCWKSSGKHTIGEPSEPENEVSNSNSPQERLTPNPRSLRSLGSPEAGSRALAEFLEDPPKWWIKQAGEVLRCGSPERLVKPLVSTTAGEVLGDVRRWEEIRPAVDRKLREMEGCG